MQVLASQLHFLVSRKAELAVPPLFWPVNCIKIGGHVALLSCPSIYFLFYGIANTSKFTQQCNVVPYYYAVCWLPSVAANSQFSVLIRQKMQLTCWDNGNQMRNATCVDTQISIKWTYCLFPILCPWYFNFCQNCN